MPQVDLDALWDFTDPAGSEDRFRATPGDEARTQTARALGLQGRFDEALEVLNSIDLNDADERVRARHALEMGRVLNSAGNPGEARPWFDRAESHARAAGDDGLEVDAMHMLAIVAQPDDAVTLNRHALEKASASQQPKARRWRGSLLNNLGWALHDQANFTEALSVFEEALAEREASGSPQQVRIARWCIARALRSLERYADALPILQELLAVEPDGFVHEELAECLAALGGDPRPSASSALALLNGTPGIGPERIERLRALAD